MPGLTDRQQRFIEEYLTGLNGTQAVIRAGYAPGSADGTAVRLLANPCIATAIREAQAERAERTAITADMVLSQWWNIATADPNGLIQVRRTCCRHCHGEEHGYHWTESEYAAAAREAQAKDAPPPPLAGGFGFDAT